MIELWKFIRRQDINSIRARGFLLREIDKESSVQGPCFCLADEWHWCVWGDAIAMVQLDAEERELDEFRFTCVDGGREIPFFRISDAFLRERRIGPIHFYEVEGRDIWLLPQPTGHSTGEPMTGEERVQMPGAGAKAAAERLGSINRNA